MVFQNISDHMNYSNFKNNSLTLEIKKAESKTLSLVRYAIVEKTKAAYSNPFPAV